MKFRVTFECSSGDTESLRLALMQVATEADDIRMRLKDEPRIDGERYGVTIRIERDDS